MSTDNVMVIESLLPQGFDHPSDVYCSCCRPEDDASLTMQKKVIYLACCLQPSAKYSASCSIKFFNHGYQIFVKEQ